MKKFAVLLTTTLLFAMPALAEEKAADAPAATGAAAAGSTADYVIAKVGDAEIKKSEVERAWNVLFPGGNAPAFDSMVPGVRDNILRGIATEHLLLREAEKSGIADKQETKDAMRTVQNQVLIQQFLKEKTKEAVSDEKIKAVYDEQVKARPAGQQELHARHILVKTEEEAKAIAKQLKGKGADFAAIAKEKSEDKGSGASGGDLGWFTADRMVPEFAKAAFALKKGETSAPVKTDFGWHIIKVEDTRAAPPPALDSMRDQIRNQLGRVAVTSFMETVTKDKKFIVLDAKGEARELSLSQAPEPVAPVEAPAAGGQSKKPE